MIKDSAVIQVRSDDGLNAERIGIKKDPRDILKVAFTEPCEHLQGMVRRKWSQRQCLGSWFVQGVG